MVKQYSYFNQTSKRRAFIFACLINLLLLLLLFISEMNRMHSSLFLSSPEDAFMLHISTESTPQENGLMIQGIPDGNENTIFFFDQLPEFDRLPQEDSLTQHPVVQELASLLTTSDLPILSALPCQQSLVDTETQDDYQTDTKDSKPVPAPNNRPQGKSPRFRRTMSSKQKLKNIAASAMQLCAPRGNAALTDYGDPHKLPSDLQMVKERHWIKTTHILQQSFNTYHHKIASVAHVTTTGVHLTYLPNGFIDKVIITRSSGSEEVDAFILFLFKDISNEVPPVPKRLKTLINNGFSCTISILPHGFYVS